MITIDTREDQPEIWKVISRLDCNVPDFEFKKLDLGDYLVENGPDSLLIERKELHDFCATYGELKSRLDKMREKYDRTALLLEGTYMVQGDSVMLWRGKTLCPSMKYQTFVNFLASQQARGSYLYFTNNLRETMMQICILYDYLPRMGKYPARKTKSATEWLAQLPGVGLLSVFGLRDKYSTPNDALKSIEDWAPKKARNILTKW